MNYEINAYTLAYLFAAGVSAAAALTVWRRRHAPGAYWLLCMIGSVLVWTLADALDSAASGLPVHIFWAQVSTVGSSTVAVFMLLFAMEYTNRKAWVTPVTVAALFIVPVLSILAAFTNELHGLIWTSFTPIAGAAVIQYAHGPLYWAKNTYIYVVAAGGAFLLFGFAMRARRTYRYQAMALIIALLVPLFGELVYDFLPNPWPGLDIASITLSISAATFALALWRLKLLDLVPVAREMLVEGQDDGIVVLDQKGRIVDLNPAAIEMVGAAEGREWIGASVDEFMADWPDLAEWVQNCSMDESTDHLVSSPQSRQVSVHSAPLHDGAGRCTGSLAVMRDLTGHIEAEQALQRANEQLHERLREIESLQAELREQAIRDPLTGLYNRRYLAETLERELARAMREGYPVSVVMADIDHFKGVNDTYGHAAGDLVLRSIGCIVRSDTRPGDIACRYGGEEFLLVLPNTDARTAYERAEEWGGAIRESKVSWLGHDIRATMSLGVASFPLYGATGEEVIAAADLALYAAKAAGRDRVELACSHGPGGPDVRRLA